MPTNDYSLQDLCSLADVTPRTVRYYIAEGLLPRPSGQGPGSHYDDGHLSRLRLIKRLQKEHLPLSEIRRRLEGMRDEDVEQISTGSPMRVAEGTALDYLRGVLGSSDPDAPAVASAAAIEWPLHVELDVFGEHDALPTRPLLGALVEGWRPRRRRSGHHKRVRRWWW